MGTVSHETPAMPERDSLARRLLYLIGIVSETPSVPYRDILIKHLWHPIGAVSRDSICTLL
jgi:hypothetical protein